MSLIYKIGLIIVAVILLASVGFNVYQHFSNDSLSKDLAVASANLTTAQANNKTLTDTIATQNKQIDAAHKISAGFQTSLDAIGDTLTKNDQKNTTLINALKNAPAPKTCDDSKKYLKDNLELYKW
jgi:ATP-dependent helicase/DNAse subunit B